MRVSLSAQLTSLLVVHSLGKTTDADIHCEYLRNHKEMVCQCNR